MLMALLGNGGKAMVRDVATSILINEESQIEYYEEITKEMVGRALRKRHLVQKERNEFELLDFGALSTEQVTQLIALYEEKLEDFKNRRGAKIW
jgi:ATP adenylyltransferase